MVSAQDLVRFYKYVNDFYRKDYKNLKNQCFCYLRLADTYTINVAQILQVRLRERDSVCVCFSTFKQRVFCLFG